MDSSLPYLQALVGHGCDVLAGGGPGGQVVGVTDTSQQALLLRGEERSRGGEFAVAPRDDNNSAPGCGGGCELVDELFLVGHVLAGLHAPHQVIHRRR